MSTSDPQELLLQDAWLRRVARGLVRDPHLAEDLAQDAWVVSLEKGRSHAGDRPWLRSVLRNRTGSFFRDLSARLQKERNAQRSGTAPAADEIAEELQLRERVAHELNALDEPYRTAVYLRFISGHSLRETARRLGVAPSTANERISVGLGRLRRRLDSAYDGDTRAWLALLLPWARGTATLFTTTTLTGITMLTLISAATAVIWNLGLLALGAAPEPAPSPSALSPSTATVSPETRVLPSELATSGAGRAPILIEAPLANDGDPTPVDTAHVHGVFLRADGTPAAGATWVLEGRRASAARVLDHGLPENWSDPTGLLDASGHLDVSFTAHPAFQFYLTVELEGHVHARWQWASIGAVERMDVGTVALRAAGSIEGRVIDGAGEPLANKTWFVYAQEAGVAPELGLQGASEGPIPTDAAARYHVSGMPAGPVQLKLYDRLLGWISGPEVQVVAGQSTAADFVVDQPSPFADGIVLKIRTEPFALFPEPSAAHVTLLDGLGNRRVARRDSIGYVFPNVGPGPHRAEVNDPRFAAWSRDGLAPGAVVQVQARGSATVRFRVTDASGQRAHGFEMEAQLLGVGFSPSRFLAASAAEPLPSDAFGESLTGLIPGDYRFTIEAAGVSAVATVRDLGAGETRDVEVSLEPTDCVRGTVRDANGAALEGRLVRLVTPALVDDSPASAIVVEGAHFGGDSSRMRHEFSRTVTDANGAFRLARDGQGAHIVVVGEDPEPRTERRVDELEPGAPAPELTLTLERGAVLAVHVAVPSGASSAGWGLVFVRNDPPRPGVNPMPYAFAEQDGRFRLGPIPAGPGQLVLVTSLGALEAGQVPAGGSVLDTRTLLEGEVVTASYPYPGPPSVAVTFDLSNGVGAAETVTVALVSADDSSTTVARGPASDVGPLTVAPGSYSTWCRGEGWLARAAETNVRAGDSRPVVVDLDLSARRVRVLDGAGQPLAHRTLYVEGAPNALQAAPLETDGQGWIELQLGRGAYTLRVETLEPALAFLAGAVDWPLATGVDALRLE